MRFPLLSLCFSFLSVFLFVFPCFVLGDPAVKIRSPAALVASVNGPSGAGSFYFSSALFGFPDKLGSFTGRLVNAPDSSYGCDLFTVTQDVNRYWYQTRALKVPIILLIQRGGDCSFVQKVRNAQAADVSAVIVVNNRPGNLPVMVDDGGGGAVRIPSILIDQRDGQRLNDALVETEPAVQIQWFYSVPQPDGRVTVDLWSISYENSTNALKQRFKIINKALDKRIDLNLHFLSVPGSSLLEPCTIGDLSAPQCADCTNSGRYCAYTGDSNPGMGLKGKEIIRENLREICLWNSLKQTNQEDFLYSYWNFLYSHCGKFSDWMENSQCQYSLMDSLKIPGVSSTMIKDCIRNSGGFSDNGGENSLFEAEANFQRYYGLQFSTATFSLVNKVAVAAKGAGNDVCRNPLKKKFCNALMEICDSFASGEAPSACSAQEICPFGESQDACGMCGVGDANRPCTAGSSESSDTSRTVLVVFLILFGVGILASGAFCYLKRQKQVMREEVASLLAQYLPLEEEINNAAKNNRGGGNGQIGASVIDPGLSRRLGLDTLRANPSEVELKETRKNQKEKLVNWTRLDSAATEEVELELGNPQNP